jgi:hypothetical protein
MGTAFVFDPGGSYGKVQAIRNSGTMPDGVRYLASVTGPWKLFAVVEFAALGQMADRVDGLSQGQGFGDPPTSTVFGPSKIRRSVYKEHTAFVRIQTNMSDPSQLLPKLAAALGISQDELEADSVVGDLDVLVCLVDDDEENLAGQVLTIRGVEGVRRTVTLRVIDYVSASENAPDDGHRIPSGM